MRLGRWPAIPSWVAARLLGAVIAIGLGMFGLRYLEAALIFFPDRHLVLEPGRYGLPAEELSLRTADGVRLHGWWLHGAGAPAPVERAPGPPPRSSERSERPGEGYSQRATGDGVSASQRVLVWFHGNAGNVGHRLPFAQALVTSFGLDVVLVDYRGYGRSDGVPSEAGLYLDGRAMYAAATERGFAPEQIVLFGESLGAAVALDVAAEHPSGALIVEAPFLSIPAMARVVYPFLPTRLITTRFDNEAKIARVTVPKLFLQAERDEIVPPAQTRRLYELAPAPKEYAVIPRATHNTMFRDGGADYLEAWRRFLHRDQPIG